MSKKEIECKTTLNTDTKPKQPPKTLPKPSEETRRRTLGKSAVLKWTSFSQKRLSWRSENEKLNNVQSHKSESKPTEKHTEIFQTLEEKHIKSPTFENTDLSFTYDKGNVARKLNYEGDEFADRKSLTNTVNDKKIVTVEKLTNGQNKLTYGVQSLDAGDTQSSRKQTVQDTEFLTPATVQNDQSRKKIEQASIANLTEPSRFETKSTKQVTNDYQSINPGTTKSQEMPAPDAYYRGKEDDGIRDSEDDITPTNTPILRKIAASREYDDDVTPRNTPKLKAVKIKQEMFPREPTRLTKDSDVTYFRNGQYSACIGQVSADDGQPNMYDDTQKTENSQVNTDVNQPNEDDGQTDGHSDFGVKFYIDDDDSYDDNIVRRDGGRRRSDDRRRGVYGLGSIKDGDHCGDISVGNLSGLLTNGLLDAQCQDKLRNKEGPNKLLSEIVELEGNSLDGTSTGKSRFDEEELRNESCKTPVSPLNGSPCVNRSFSRSQSLPTSSLQGYGQPKIVYKNGHFVIETGLESQYEEEEEHISTKQESVQRPLPHVIGPKCKNTPNKDVCKSLTKRRSNSEADLLDKDMDDDEDDADVFLQNEGDITVIDNRRVEKSWHIHVKRRTKPLNDEDGGKSSRPASIDEGQLQWSVEDLRQNKMKPKKNNDIKRRSASFKELRSFKLKRNSSFREAQEKGTLMKQYGKNESMGNLSMSPSEISVTSEGRSRGILNRMFKRNKSFNDKGSIAANEQTLGRRDSSREIKNRKMSLKTLFGLKSKSDSSQQRGQDESMTTVSPPMAVFQSDMDINVIGSAPNSPYSSQKFHRRHTAADLYSNQSHTLPRRPSDIPKALTSSKDHSSVRSLNIQNLANHPMRPISPKPTGIVITRRNSNVSLPNSPLRDGSSDSRGSSLRASHSTLDSSDTVSTCSGNSTDLTPTSPPLGPDDSRCANASSPQDRERYSTLVQGGEMTSSNSNDSGIQRDVSINSSSESLKTIQDLSPTTVVRRRKSPSPRPERPKSEISVRWADLVETNEITPVKRRDSQSSHRQRPKSDLGGSSFSDEMRPFGSQLSLLPYSSLQSLDTLRRQDSFDQKPNKRRMSTPHPIKTRLERSPRKQKKRNPLVRSHSMPESLDKLYRKKRFFSTASSNLHKEEFLRGTFEDDSCSDDGSDYSSDQISLHEKSLSARSSTTYLSTLEERPEGDNLTYAEALWDHITMDQEELGFRAGDVIEVADMTDKDWWWGAIDDKEGWFPAAFVRLRVNQERLGEELSGRLEEVSEDSSPLLHRISVLNKEQARENVVNEILTAERDYVKHLRDVVEGYIKHARKRTDMFNEERIAVIFGNMEHIYNFSSEFLQKIEKAFQKDHPYLSELGQCFLHYSKDFEIYSDYCNNHPAASEELKDLYRKQKYRHFFEACRLLQEMVEIPLEGFLLTPVQKICKYPLQLSELLKYTPPSHPDHENVAGALAAMKKIAALINERKRKMESIEKLARWQTMVEDWQGADLIEESSELIMSGEMYKVNSAGWSQERNFFLFDHQLIYCKKDLLKRNGYSYRGRVDLDDCEIHPLEDGKETQYNVTVKNAWKLHEVVRDKWYLLYTKTETEKQKWLKAFNSERQRVKEDQENNFVPFEWKRTILNRIKSSQERGRRTPVPSSDFMRGIPSHATLPRSYSKKVQKKKGWFIFGNKKTK